MFERPRRIFISNEKREHVLQKEGVLDPCLAMLLICDL